MQDPRLIRLCLTHAESDRFSIIETYYPDEIENAISSAIVALHRRKHMLTIGMLDTRTYGHDIRRYPKGLQAINLLTPTSRSTDELRNGPRPIGLHLPFLGGVRSL